MDRTQSPSPDADARDTLGILRTLREICVTDDARDLLRNALAAACRLTGASGGVLGVHDELHHGQLAQVYRYGAVTDLPEAELAALLRPEGPPAGIAADILVDGDRFGMLRLTGWETSPGPRERILAECVASAAGLHLDTLRQRRISDLHQQVTTAVWEVDRTLVDEVDLDVTLPLLVARVRELAAADVVALVGGSPTDSRPVPSPTRVLASAGDGVGAALADLGPDVAEVSASGRAQHWTTTLPAPDGAARGEVLGTSLVPIDTRTGSPLVLVAHHWRALQGVSHQRMHDVLTAVALHASIILDRARGEEEHDLLTVLEDRDRIARDLHDLVIQRLFAVGLTVQGAARRAVRPEVSERLENAVAELDQTIRDIRATIFELRHRAGVGSFRADLRQLVESYTPTLGYAATLQLTGPIDSVTGDEAQTQVLMVVREALSNVARHAHATATTVSVEATTDRLTVSVSDDGVGIRGSAVESGLSNVRARAREHGGAVELLRLEPHGTRLSWSIPV